MKGYKISEFIDNLFNCPDLEYIYKGKTHILSVWCNKDRTYTLEINQYNQEGMPELIYTTTNATILLCVENYEQAHLYDGRTIYEAESEIEVLFG